MVGGCGGSSSVAEGAASTATLPAPSLAPATTATSTTAPPPPTTATTTAPATPATTTTTAPTPTAAGTTIVAVPVVPGTCPSWKLVAKPRIAAPDITEASGLAGGRVNRGVWWTHNDSGDTPRVFALDGDARLLTTVAVEGADAWDWEDIDIGPGPEGRSYLYVSDLGDNFQLRQGTIGYQIYRFPEPALGHPAPATMTVTGERINVSYPDGSHNTEATFFDPQTGDEIIITKESPAAVYRIAAADLVPGRTVVPTKIGQIALDHPTGADISPDGSMIAVKTLLDTSFWPRPRGQSAADVLVHERPCPVQSLGPGEAIAFDATGRQVATVSEGRQQPLYRYERS
jgi:hypothetical protein